MDEHMPDKTQSMDRRLRKSAEEEYDEIQQRSRKNPQEPRHLRGRLRNNEPHDNAEDAFIAPRRLARKKSIKQMFTNMWSFNKKQATKNVNEEVKEENLNLQEKITIYSRSRQIIDGKCFIQRYVDTRDLESIMKLIHKGIRFN